MSGLCLFPGAATNLLFQGDQCSYSLDGPHVAPTGPINVVGMLSAPSNTCAVYIGRGVGNVSVGFTSYNAAFHGGEVKETEGQGCTADSGATVIWITRDG